MATRKKLPNLKICVDNTESSSESDVEVQESDSSDSDEEDTLEVGGIRSAGGLEEGEVHEDDVLSIAVDRPTERRFLSRSSLRSGQRLHTYGPKIYENKSGNFVTGVDVTSEEACEKREKRAERFGTLSTPKQPITDVDIKNLYRSLGMNIQTLDQDPRGWRMEAIMIRGTENMSTKDVFDYFSEYGPKGVEWIDDFSCNVIWLDKLTPARALIKLSSSFDEVQLAEKIVDEQMDDAPPQDLKESNQDSATSDVVVKVEKDSITNSAMDTIHGPSKEPGTVSGQEKTADIQKEPVLNVLEEETMELDFDDNLDLTAEDPIDQALSTWSNFTQNKKERAERAEAERKKAEKREKDANESLSEKEKRSDKISEKEVDDSDEKEDGNKRTGSNIGVTGQQKSSGNDDQNIDNRAIEERRKNRDLSVGKKTASKQEKKGGSKDTGSEKSKPYKKKEKMETEDGSDSDSGSSSSSSSSSGSSSSGSSSGSDSDSGSNSSGSSSSSSSSSSSGNSSEGNKKKKKKTKEERDRERQQRKTTKKPEAPPIPPASREKSEIPWPPGWWRLGVPCPKADYLFLRYAMKADKKLPGAEKRSKYYVKHGNPNFGGIKGLISNSRKRRLRNIERDEEMFETSEKEDIRPALGPISTGQSRLAGRLGTAGGKLRREEMDREEGEVEEVENARPKLKEGKDLRDLLNRDASALKYESGEEPVQGRDSDDEMDYGAELERLMGDEEPPSKKRFMRMHADDEEEKIQAQRVTRVNRDSRNWSKQDYDEYKEDRGDSEEEEGEIEDTEIVYPRRKEWVDYDNVEDDDPFNLFGTSKKEAIPSSQISDFDDEDDMDHRGRYRRDDSQGGRRDRNLKNRLGSLHDHPREERGGAALGGGIDLRAKLQGRRRAGNRNW